MSEAIGALRADLSANAAQFQSDMQAARNAVQANAGLMTVAFWNLEKSADAAITSIATMRAAGAALAASGLILATRAAIDFTDQIGKTAAKLGLTTDALQELRYAAKLSNVSVEDFDTSFGKMQKTVGDAISGNASLKKFFNDGLLIPTEQLKTLAPDKLFELIVDKLNSIPDAAQRAAAANVIFGKSWQTILPLAQKGSDAIEEARAAAEELGLVLSGADVEGAQKASDLFGTMGQVIKIGLIKAIDQLLPLLDTLADDVTDPNFQDGLTDMAKGFGLIAVAVTKVVEAYGALLKIVKSDVDYAMGQGNNTTSYHDSVKAVAKLLNIDPKSIDPDYQVYPSEMKGAAKTGAHGTKTLPLGDLSNLVGSGKSIGDQTIDMEAQTLAMLKLIDLNKNYAITADDAATQQKLENEALKNHIDLTTRAGAAWEFAFREREQTTQDLRDQKKILDEIKPPLTAYNEEIGHLNDLQDRGVITQDQLNQELDKAQERFVNAQSAVHGLAGAGKEMGDSFGNAIDDMIFSTDKLSVSLNNLLLNILKIAEQKAISQPIGNMLGALFSTGLSAGTGWLTGLFDGSSSGGAGGGSAGPSIIPVTSEILPDITPHAQGGITFPGSQYLVGEQGPEILTMGSMTGHITPNDAIGGNKYIIDARGADQGAVQRMEALLLTLAGPGVVERRVVDAQRRGSIK